jgi:CTP:molybdopterin cytidylyltransferase MocA
MIVGVVLAAGGSTRMGRPKALLPVGGVPLVRVHEAALGAVCGEVRVVVGAYEAEILGVLTPRARVVRNPRWSDTGPRESLLLALEDLPPHATVVITPVDVPPASRPALAALIAARPPAVLAHGASPGHPVRVAAGVALACLRAGGTLRDVLGSTPTLIEAGAEVLLNLNTPAEWSAWAGGEAAIGGPDAGARTTSRDSG